jgi:FeS assembly SUF system regulator
MIRIGKLTDYAILILSVMGRQITTLSAAYIAENLHLTTPTVSKVLKMLAEAKLVKSIRGVEGGYYLAKPIADITVADVILAMEGEIYLTACCEQPGLCTIDTFCSMRENWIRINKMVHSFLAQWKVMDICTPLSEAEFSQRFAWQIA